MKKYVTRIKGSDHFIYKIGFGTYDILKIGLTSSEIKEILSDFVSMGGNVIDTSRFDIGVRKSEVEDSQKLVGEWIRDFKKRKVSCLISKSNFLVNGSNDFENSLNNDIETSLKNLCTDYLDIFLVNGDDEKTDVSIILNNFEKLKKDGKILSYGCSNWKPYRIRQAMEFATKNNIDGFTVNQMLWNIGSKYMNPLKSHNDIYIKMDEEMMDIHKQYDILAMPYNSLANGIFSKLYINESEPGAINIEKLKENSPYYNDKNLVIYERMKELGIKYIASPGWVSLGYLFNQEIETCSILACKNLSQLREAFEAVDRGYTRSDFEGIDIFEKDMVMA